MAIRFGLSGWIRFVMVKFDGIEELVTQLKSDEEVARNWERSE